MSQGEVRALGVSTVEPNPNQPRIRPIADALIGFDASMLPGNTPEEMEALVRSEQMRWKEVIDSAGIAVRSTK